MEKEGHEEPPAAGDGDHAFPAVEGADNLPRCLFHRDYPEEFFGMGEERGADKAGAYVGDIHGVTAGHGDLLQRLEIVGLVGLGGRVGGGGTESAQRGDGADGGEVARLLLEEEPEDPVDHGGPSHDIGGDGVLLDGGVEGTVHLADAGAENEQVDMSAQALQQPGKRCDALPGLLHIGGLIKDMAVARRQLLQQGSAAGGDTYAASAPGINLGERTANAGGGSQYNNVLLFHTLCKDTNCMNLQKRKVENLSKYGVADLLLYCFFVFSVKIK